MCEACNTRNYSVPKSPSCSLENPVDLSQLEALDGRRTIARRSLGDKNAAPPLLRQPAASALPAAGPARRSGPPPSRRSSRETVRRLSNLGPNPGGMLQPILSGQPLLPSETLSGQLAGLRATSGPPPPAACFGSWRFSTEWFGTRPAV